MNIHLEDVKKKFGKKAKEYAQDKNKTRQLVDKAIKKARKIGPFDDIWENTQLLFHLVKDWSTGKYTDIPKGSIVAIIMGLLYFVSPIDFIPDFLLGGLVDDAFVLGLIFKQVKSDLDHYKKFKDN